MKKKTKIPTKKEIENNFSDWISVGPANIEKVKTRNSARKLEKKARKLLKK